ncbi:MAG: glycosyl hydrolase family 28-related protein, partial [Bacteroidota bacterium]
MPTVNVITTTISAIQASTDQSPDDVYYTTDTGQEGFWLITAVTGLTTNGIQIISNSPSVLHPAGQTFIRQSGIFEGTINVKWFGASGLGSSDDYDYIQAAINYITTTTYTYPTSHPTGGGIVFFPEGRYLISKGLIVGQYCTLKGISKGGDHYPVSDWNPAAAHQTGSVIICSFADGTDPAYPDEKWAVQSACYVNATGNLLDYDDAVTHLGALPFDYTITQGIVIDGLIFLGGWSAESANWGYGAIKLSNSPNSLIKDCGFYNFHIGVLASACHGGTKIENCYMITNWYGIVDVWNNLLLIENCYINGFDCDDPFTEQTLPAFIYRENTVPISLSSLYLDDNVLFGSCGIYCCNIGEPESVDGSASGLTVISTVVQRYTNGITSIYSGLELSGIHIECGDGFTLYGVAV